MRRSEAAGAPGVVVWITGLAGAGKTTLGQLLAERMRARGRDVVFLDGDDLRAAVFPDAGYTPEERRELARKYTRIARLLSNLGRDVVCATISMSPEVWERNRRELESYREVLVRAPAEVRRLRRPLLEAEPGAHVVGRDEPAPEPPDPHAIVLNDGTRTPEQVVEQLWSELRLPGTESGSVPFGTKAETLARLEPILRSARVLPQVRFTAAAWRADSAAVLAQLRERGWLERPLIVRSSARDEDLAEGSRAGHYLSLGARRGAGDVATAIEEVVADLARETRTSSGADQVFVQPYLDGVRMSGVALTRDPSSGSRYTVVAYDDSTGRTDSITSGRAEERRTFYHHRSAPLPEASSVTSADLRAVLTLVRELEELSGQDALDIEFAISEEGHLHLLQVRPLRLAYEAPAVGAAEEARAVARVAAKLEHLSRPHPYLYGSRAVFGTMPDWNPAEVIGVRPKPLATSLYKELITDGIWAYQRSNYGYRNLRSFPLLITLGGLPYIDVRVSFNSFLPAELEPELGRRLVDHYIARLLAAPEGHDKVEFEIVHSCATLDLDRRLEALAPHGFDAGERAHLAAGLRALTRRILAEPDGLFRRDVAKIQELERRQRTLADEATRLDPVARIFWLLEDCKRYGTLPFAGIARAAFIAVQLLQSLVTAGVLEPAQREQFLRSLRTIPSALTDDLRRASRADFLAKYGHLRPGTYDITSARYDEAPDAYFEWDAMPRAGEAAPPEPRALEPRPLELRTEQAARLDRLLAESELGLEHAGLFRFLRDAIEGREHAKFVFSRSLSDALATLTAFGAELGFAPRDLAFADIEAVRRLHASSDDARAVLAASIDEGRRRFAVTRRLTLPPLVTGPRDAFAFHLPACEPNYVTLGSATGPVVAGELTPGGTAARRELRGGIVMVQSADPGHDWIFAHEVAGFITMYGGYNSHMAIRANELGIPAVIGAGESLFQTWAAASRLRVDCLNRRVEVLA